jgi:hypothetical protein
MSAFVNSTLLVLALSSSSVQAADFYSLSPADNRWPQVTEQSEAPVGNPLAANYYLVFDGSGSMAALDCGDGQRKIEVARDAIRQFAEQVPADANLGLYGFDRKGESERIALGVDNRARFQEAVAGVSAGNNTPLKASTQFAYRQLTKQAERQRGYGEYHLVVVTDGASTDGDPMSAVTNILKESPVLVETIGFCINEKHSLNQPGLTSYRSAHDPESLRKGLAAVLAEAPDFTPAQFAPPPEKRDAAPTQPPPPPPATEKEDAFSILKKLKERYLKP